MATKSPNPASPEKVSAAPPIALPNLANSANPRVTTAALVLSPVPKPVVIPTANARTFLNAPPNSQPTTSSLV